MLNSVFSFALNATTPVADITTAAPKTEFNPSGFLEQLPKMGIGMLSIFIVIGLIIGVCVFPTGSYERETFMKGWTKGFVITLIISLVFGVIYGCAIASLVGSMGY